MKDRRIPRAVYRVGEDPDPRLSLANERTFLAWIRTSLALIATGVALEALHVPIRPDFRLAAAGVFVVLGLVAPIHAWVSWMRTERAMRQNQSLPGPTLSGLVVLGVSVAAVLVIAGAWL